MLFVYIIMVSLFESYIHPFTIMFSLPVALVGAFIGLAVLDLSLNMFSMIGIIMLMGLVTKNAILLVDFTNTLRSRGREMHEALLEAGKTRLRPIIMTTATMVFGMMPLALALGAGSEMRQGMAVVVVGGLISSTLLTLVLDPGHLHVRGWLESESARLVPSGCLGRAAPMEGETGTRERWNSGRGGRGAGEVESRKMVNGK